MSETSLQDEQRLRQLGDLFAEEQTARETLGVLSELAASGSSTWPEDRHSALTARIADHITEHPDDLFELRIQERAKALAAVGMLGVLGKQMEPHPEEASLQRETLSFLGRSTQILQGIQHFESTTSAKVLPEDGGGTVLSNRANSDNLPAVAPVELSELEVPPNGALVIIDGNGAITVNHHELQLLPVQRTLLELLVNIEKPCRKSEIYEQARFVEALKTAGITSSLSIAFHNALKSVETHLGKHNIPLEQIITVAGGGPRSQVYVRNPNLVVRDARIEARATGLADYFFDQIDLNHPIDPTELATGFFETETVLPQHKPAVQIAIAHLRKNLEGDGLMVVVHEDGRLELREKKPNVQQRTTEKAITTRGDFRRIEDDELVFENERVRLSEAQVFMLSMLREQHQRGVTRAHMRNTAQERGYDASGEFDREFARLATLLGPHLKRQMKEGRARFVLRTRV